jgi:hypothetical protein
MNVIRIIAISLPGLLAVAILALSILPYFAHTATLDYLSGFRHPPRSDRGLAHRAQTARE